MQNSKSYFIFYNKEIIIKYIVFFKIHFVQI
jgi:hypothetical protein